MEKHGALIDKIESLGYILEPNRWGSSFAGRNKALKILTIRPVGAHEAKTITWGCPIAIGCGKVANFEEAKANAAAGIGIALDTAEPIYRSYYAEGKTDREWELMQCNYSERAYDAIEAEKKRLHIISADYPNDFIELENIVDPEIAINACSQLGKVPGADEWVLQFAVSYGDDVGIYRYRYSERPTIEDARHTAELYQIIFALKTDKFSEEFVCWECGRKVFWLDCGKDIYDSAKMAEDKYCGC